MQLVGGSVRVLRPGAGPDKTDLVVDAAKVEEMMGVPPGKSRRRDGIDGRFDRQHSRRERHRRKRREGTHSPVWIGGSGAGTREGSRRKALPRGARKQPRSGGDVEAARRHRYGRAGEARARRSSRERSGRGSLARALRGAGIYFAASRSARRTDCRVRRAERFRGARISRGAQEISERHSAQRRNRRLADARRGRARSRRGFGSQSRSGRDFAEAGRFADGGARRQGRNARRARGISPRPRAPENRARPKTRRAAGRARRRNPPRDDAVFLSVAPHDRETQPGRRGVAAGKRHALRRSRGTRGTFAAPRAALAQGSRGAGPRGTVRDDRPAARAGPRRDGARRRARRSQSARRDVQNDGARNSLARKINLETGRVGIQRQFAAATRRNFVRQDGS